ILQADPTAGSPNDSHNQNQSPLRSSIQCFLTADFADSGCPITRAHDGGRALVISTGGAARAGPSSIVFAQSAIRRLPSFRPTAGARANTRSAFAWSHV